MVARWAHNPKVAGSSPVPATNQKVPESRNLFSYPSPRVRCGSRGSVGVDHRSKDQRDRSIGIRFLDHRARDIFIDIMAPARHGWESFVFLSIVAVCQGALAERLILTLAG